MIRLFIFGLLISSLLSVAAAAQQPVQQGGSYTTTGAYGRLHADLFSGLRQTAALANITTPGLGITGVRPFLLAGFGRYHLLTALPVKNGTFGLKAVLHGGGGYAENQLGLVYARHLGTSISAGLSFNYHQIRIAGYGQASAPGVEAGLLLHLTPALHAGLQCMNPVNGKWGAGKTERLPAVYITGLGYEVSALFYCSAEIIKEEDRPATLAVSFQYKPHARLLLRSGVETGTAVTWAGAGFQLSRCRFDLFFSFHPQLGITPGTGIIFHFKK